jgi:hypothetical protein
VQLVAGTLYRLIQEGASSAQCGALVLLSIQMAHGQASSQAVCVVGESRSHSMQVPGQLASAFVVFSVQMVWQLPEGHYVWWMKSIVDPGRASAA